MVALDIADLTWLAEGAATVLLRPTKTDLAARVEVRYLSPPATALVRTWLRRSELVQGPVFTRLQRNGLDQVGGTGRGLRLNAAAVNDRIKEAVGRSLEARGEWTTPPTDPADPIGQRAAAWSGHSLRVGAAQDMAAAGVATAAILQAGGWRDGRMV
nr:hypothetical protein [Thiocystis violacea]